MNKEKLISLIIRKETYKDTKPYLNQLAKNQDAAAKISAEAIHDILTTDYIAQAKLYALRYLKDAFQKGSPIFINLVETKILGVLVGIAVDETDQKAVTKYAGSSYTKNDELQKFKSILSSLFRMAKECLIKWAEWVPDSGRKFVEAANELKRKKVEMNFDFKYFRPQNEQQFNQFSQKNGVKQNQNNKKSGSVKEVKQTKKQKDPMVINVEKAMEKVTEAKSMQQFQVLDNNFNQHLNIYLENAVDFQEELVQQWFDQYQHKKTDVLKRLKANQTNKQKQNPVVVTPEGPSQQSSAKKEKKVDTSKQVQSKTQKASSVKKIESSENRQQKTESNNAAKTNNQSTDFVQSQRKQNDLIDKSKFNKFKQPKQSINNQTPPLDSKKTANKQTTDTKKQKLPNQISKVPKQPYVFFEDSESIEQSSIINVKDKKAGVSNQSKPVQTSIALNKSPKTNNMVKNSQSQKSKQTQLNTDYGGSQRTNLQKKVSAENNNFMNALKGQEKQVSSLKQESKISESKGKKTNNKNNDPSISRDEDRVRFSQDQQQSQVSENLVGHEIPNFKKKNGKLAAIEEENYSHDTENKNPSMVGMIRSPRDEQGLTKGNVANKLLQENKVFLEKLQKISEELETEKKARKTIEKEKHHLQKQLSEKIQNEEKMIRKIKGSVPIDDYNHLKRELEEERRLNASFKQQMNQLKREVELEKAGNAGLSEKHARLRLQHQSLIQQLNQSKQRQNVSIRSDHLKSSEVKVKSQIPQQKNVIMKEQLDEDYVRNLTHPSNIHAWLNETNINLFKKNVLGLSEIFYRDQYLTILSKGSVYTQNDQQFLAIKLTYQLKSIQQAKLQVRFRNCQELDLWSKPLEGQHPLYTQDLVIRLHRNPARILKGEARIVEGLSIRFLLPVMYPNFLREQAFSNEQFAQVWAAKGDQSIKSKIVQLNAGLSQLGDLSTVFKSSISGEGRVRFCLAEGISDQIFMGQFQLLRNSKLLLRLLPIPSSEEMLIKARELMDNLLFLVS